MKHLFLQFAIGTLMDDYLGWYQIDCKKRLIKVILLLITIIFL